METIEINGDDYPATRGEPVDDERVVDGLRVWSPAKSKLAALLVKDVDLGLEDAKVLYLGAGAGSTASYVADVADVVYAVEFAPAPAEQLVEVAESRGNLFPIVEDARLPERYAAMVERVDLLYMDVATRGQADVAVRNAMYLRPEGTLCLVVKARSEDVAMDPEDVYHEVAEQLGETYSVDRVVDLEPFYTDHAAVLATKKED